MTPSDTTRTGGWPELTLAGWEDTGDTLHLWTQVVGQLRLALEPMINHGWQVPLHVSERGLTTSLVHADRVLRQGPRRVRASRLVDGRPLNPWSEPDG